MEHDSEREKGTKVLESMSAYYGEDESSTREDGELIWGKYTDEQWENMTVSERADAFWAHHHEQMGA